MTQPAACLAEHTADGQSGGSSTQSSSGGSGTSSPQRVEEDKSEDKYDSLVPPAPLPGQPRSDELDMWEVLMSLDGEGARRRRRPPGSTIRRFFARTRHTREGARRSSAKKIKSWHRSARSP